MDATVKPPAELKVWVDPHLKASEPKKTVRLLARRAKFSFVSNGE